ncbi:MAG: ATP phosphoribosyltransferase [Candidatus Woesebacteria bacterium]|jgi:ATP phosphoribosyltransferase
MTKLNNNKIKLAIQKSGRLTDETVAFLKLAGLEFETYNRKLFSNCRNFPLEIIYSRDDDITDYVSTGIVDLGIIGQNVVNEKRKKIKKLLNLRFSFCSLVVAVAKDSKIKKLSDLQGLKIASSYPKSAKKFFKEKNIKIKLIEISGSVEAAPLLGIADAIVDLVSTGSTLAQNDLRILETIYKSEAVLIANPDSLKDEKKAKIIKQLLTRFKGVLSAQRYKYIMMNAPEDILPKLKKIIPGLKSPTLSLLAKKPWVSVQSVIKEDVFWETVERLKKVGAEGIIVLPIEKMIL